MPEDYLRAYLNELYDLFKIELNYLPELHNRILEQPENFRERIIHDVLRLAPNSPQKYSQFIEILKKHQYADIYCEGIIPISCELVHTYFGKRPEYKSFQSFPIDNFLDDDQYFQNSLTILADTSPDSLKNIIEHYADDLLSNPKILVGLQKAKPDFFERYIGDQSVKDYVLSLIQNENNIYRTIKKNLKANDTFDPSSLDKINTALQQLNKNYLTLLNLHSIFQDISISYLPSLDNYNQDINLKMSKPISDFLDFHYLVLKKIPMEKRDSFPTFPNLLQSTKNPAHFILLSKILGQISQDELVSALSTPHAKQMIIRFKDDETFYTELSDVLPTNIQPYLSNIDKAWRENDQEKIAISIRNLNKLISIYQAFFSSFDKIATHINYDANQLKTDLITLNHKCKTSGVKIDTLWEQIPPTLSNDHSLALAKLLYKLRLPDTFLDQKLLADSAKNLKNGSKLNYLDKQEKKTFERRPLINAIHTQEELIAEYYSLLSQITSSPDFQPDLNDFETVLIIGEAHRLGYFDKAKPLTLFHLNKDLNLRELYSAGLRKLKEIDEKDIELLSFEDQMDMNNYICFLDLLAKQHVDLTNANNFKKLEKKLTEFMDLQFENDRELSLSLTQEFMGKLVSHRLRFIHPINKVHLTPNQSTNTVIETIKQSRHLFERDRLISYIHNESKLAFSQTDEDLFNEVYHRLAHSKDIYGFGSPFANQQMQMHFNNGYNNSQKREDKFTQLSSFYKLAPFIRHKKLPKKINNQINKLSQKEIMLFYIMRYFEHQFQNDRIDLHQYARKIGLTFYTTPNPDYKQIQFEAHKQLNAITSHSIQNHTQETDYRKCINILAKAFKACEEIPTRTNYLINSRYAFQKFIKQVNSLKASQYKALNHFYTHINLKPVHHKSSSDSQHIFNQYADQHTTLAFSPYMVNTKQFLTDFIAKEVITENDFQSFILKSIEMELNANTLNPTEFQKKLRKKIENIARITGQKLFQTLLSPDTKRDDSSIKSYFNLLKFVHYYPFMRTPKYYNCFYKFQLNQLKKTSQHPSSKPNHEPVDLTIFDQFLPASPSYSSPPSLPVITKNFDKDEWLLWLKENDLSMQTDGLLLFKSRLPFLYNQEMEVLQKLSKGLNQKVNSHFQALSAFEPINAQENNTYLRAHNSLSTNHKMSLLRGGTINSAQTKRLAIGRLVNLQAKGQLLNTGTGKTILLIEGSTLSSNQGTNSKLLASHSTPLQQRIHPEISHLRAIGFSLGIQQAIHVFGSDSLKQNMRLQTDLNLSTYGASAILFQAAADYYYIKQTGYCTPHQLPSLYLRSQKSFWVRQLPRLKQLTKPALGIGAAYGVYEAIKTSRN